MIISHDRQFVFIHIHKTGGDSIAAALAPVVRRGDIVLKSDFQRWRQGVTSGARQRTQQDQLRKHSTAAAVREHLSVERWERYFTFAFVRHPISRAMSLYTYAKAKAEERQKALPRNLWYMLPTGYRSDPLQWPSVVAYRETGSFSAFLRHPLVLTAPGMQLQWKSVCDESHVLLVDYVGRFEELDEHFGIVQDRLGIPRRPLPWRNSSGGRRGHALTVADEDRALLVDRFSEDFRMFGYDPEASA